MTQAISIYYKSPTECNFYLVSLGRYGVITYTALISI